MQCGSRNVLCCAEHRCKSIDKNREKYRKTKAVTTATILWIADKSGKNLRKILTVDLRDNWHLDVKNSKTRIVKKDMNTFLITEADW